MRVLLLLLAACSQKSVGLGDDSGVDTSVPPPATAPIYVHDAGTLYTWSPTAGPSVVGPFVDASGAPIGTVADIAIDADGQLFGAVEGTLHRIDAATGVASVEAALPDRGTGLTVLPDGRLLVAGSALTALDLATGASETLVAAGAYTTSGDVVAVPDGSVHWSVGGAAGDDWVVVDPGTGATERRGSVGVSALWGVAWADETLYAFAADGGVYAVDGATGAGTLVRADAVSYYGATTNPVRW